MKSHPTHVIVQMRVADPAPGIDRARPAEGMATAHERDAGRALPGGALTRTRRWVIGTRRQA
jgi:hypothetical protein